MKWWSRFVTWVKLLFSKVTDELMPESQIVVTNTLGLEFEKPTFDVTHIIIHHSDTKDSGAIDWDAITRYHIEHNGWADNGYNWGLELVGDTFQILKGRPMSIAGAHTRDGRFNQRSVGVCVVGDWDKEAPPREQLFLAQSLVRDLQKFLHVKRENVIGHREAQQIAGVARKNRKNCPGLRFPLSEFREKLLA